MAVLELKNNPILFNTVSDDSWIKFISSDMIDATEFHKKLDSEYEGLHLAISNNHRLLFHWAFNAKPWNKHLEDYLDRYCKKYGKDPIVTKNEIRRKITDEQGRRNKLIMKKTSDVFDFKGERELANIFSAIAYNLHILGDYMSDNRVLEGLEDFNNLVGQIVITFRNLDNIKSRELIKGITKINHMNIDVKYKADKLMAYLKDTVPEFIKSAKGGQLKRRLESKGYVFIK